MDEWRRGRWSEAGAMGKPVGARRWRDEQCEEECEGRKGRSECRAPPVGKVIGRAGGERRMRVEEALGTALGPGGVLVKVTGGTWGTAKQKREERLGVSQGGCCF